jgi:endonuclease-3
MLDVLEAMYGPPRPLPTSDPLELVLWENIAYLQNDQRRQQAFGALVEQVGTRPEQLLAAERALLVRITRIGGIHAELRAERLQEIARIVLEEFDGDVASALRQPLPKARRLLTKFPAIGPPGAEKILLLTRSHPVLALESNGLRVLLRLGYGEEKKSYAATYRSVQSAAASAAGVDFDLLIRAHLLLRRHGQELCKNNSPRCEECPLAVHCAYDRRQRAGKSLRR